MRSQPQSLGFQQTSSGWNDESLVRCICSLHITGDRKVGVEGQEEGWWRGGKGGCYWYAPCGVNTWLISCRHSNDCLLWLICTSCRLPTEHTHREQVNANELQTFKGTFGSKSSAFRGCPVYSHVLLNSTYWKLQELQYKRSVALHYLL